MREFEGFSGRWQIPAFIVVGTINTAFGYLVFSTLIYLGLHYKLAVLSATMLGIIFNFFTIGGIVFGSIRKALLIRFVSLYIGLYFLNIFILESLANFIDNFYITGAISIIPCAFLSFLINKYCIFE